MLRKLFKRKSNDSTKTFRIQSFNSCIAQTSTPNASVALADTCACATSMPNVSVIERSTSLPILVSDASIADLQSDPKCGYVPVNNPFQIKATVCFDSPPHSSRTCPSKEFVETSSTENTTRTDFSSKGYLHKFLHKDPFKICLPKDSPWFGISKKLPTTGSLKESVRNGRPKDAPRTCVFRGLPRFYTPKGTSSTKISPRNSLPKNAPCAGSSKDSLSKFLDEDCPRTRLPTGPIKICLPNELPKSIEGSVKSLISREPCKCYSEPKETIFKCTCAESLESFTSYEAKKTAGKSECFEELYFNDQAKKIGATSGVHNIDGRSSETVKIKLVSCTDSTKIKEQDEKCQSCGGIRKDSGATSSLADSRATSATCDASASYYQNKLMATLQVLQNKEETIIIQADSLAVAEARIATLSERAHELKKELDRKTKEYTVLRKSLECKPVQKTDVCVVTDRPMEDQRDIVNTLENNLSVIEDLYRECFYETAKQENLIEMLRSSYLEVRLMDKQKADQIGRLQTVINTQQWSLDRCQDIALEVDGLKTEISNFLNISSPTNNDSGMWERSEESYAAPGVHEDLHDVRELLLRLQDLLALDSCTCDAEYMKWKKTAEGLQIRVGELQEKLCELQSLPRKWEAANKKSKAEIECKEQELASLREQLMRSQDASRDQSSTVEAISIQLGQAKALLCEKTAEVAKLRQENETQAIKIQELQEELAKADHIVKENNKMRSEVEYLSSQVSLWRTQLGDSRCRVRALEAELTRTRDMAAHIDTCYREKASKVAELQTHLDEAHERATALCGEARRAVCDVRVWMRRMRDKHRELDRLQKEKDSCIAALQRRLQERQNDSHLTSPSENIASCSKCQASRDERSFGSKSKIRWGQLHEPSTSGIPSCSSTPAPTRFRKKSANMSAAWMCDAALQAPVRQDAGCDACAFSDTGHYCRHQDVRHVRITLDRPPTQRDLSPADQLLLRVEQLSAALADGSRRWSRARDAR